jgi:dTDP-4-amino-4,6-dideoxygalactose transaminase
MAIIPFVDLKKQYLSIQPEIDHAIKSVLQKTSFIQGPYVEAFEKEFAAAVGAKHCISCANGTDAIYITLKALGIGLNDEVITVANSWISTSETISQTGATPVFVDCDADYYTINVQEIESKLTAKTKAIIPVHLYGQPADMDPIKKLCEKHNLFLIEDCAQAHLAKYKGKQVSSMGTAGTFSFFPGKNLGAYGDAGAIVTNDDDLFRKAKLYARHGALIKHQHEIEGINSRMDGLQAAILSVKLKYLSKWTKQRQKNASLYSKLLKKVPNVTTPTIRPNSSHVFHLYVIQAENRDSLEKYLKEKGIATGRHYPTPLPLLKAYQRLNMTEKNIPIASKNKDLILSLPMYPELTREQIETIVTEIETFYNS